MSKTCILGDHGVTPCENLRLSINSINSPEGNMGIHLLQTVDDEDRHVEDVFSIKNHSEQFIRMHYCPFCRTKLEK